MVKEFILQSRNASRFFRRLWYSSAVFLLITCLSTAWFGYSSYQQTIRSAAKSLWFPFRTDTILTEGNGANALSTVAKQDKDIRLSFIEGILSDENNATIFSSNPTLFLRASIQSDLILRDRLLQRLREEAHHVDSISLARMQALLELDLNAGMQQLLKTVNSAGGYRLINALGISKIVKYIAKLNKNQIKLGVALLVEMIIKTADAGLLGPLSQALAPLANKLDTHQVEQVVAHYRKMIDQTTDVVQLRNFGNGLAQLVGKLNEHQVEQVVAHYLEMIGKSTDADQLQTLIEGSIIGEQAQRASGGAGSRTLFQHDPEDNRCLSTPGFK